MDQAIQSDKDCCYQRIGPTHFQKFHNKKVSVMGEVMDGKNGIALLKMGQKTIAVGGLDLQDASIIRKIEVRGVLVSEDRIEADQITELSDNFDLPTYYKVVDLMQGQFRELFYE